MEINFKHYLHLLCGAAIFAATPIASHATPSVTYALGATSNVPGFSATWLHAGTSEMGNTGYYANGVKARMTGSLTLDMDNLASASGSLSGYGDFGQTPGNWTLDFAGGTSNSVTFADGNMDLLSLNYTLTNDDNTFSSTGTFYFADRDFNGGSTSDGPNYIDPDVLYLWGNNWVNLGDTSRQDFVSNGGMALGLDLYGVPEPGIAALLAIGLLGMGFKRRYQSV